MDVRSRREPALTHTPVGVVLVGGASRRMGRDKATLPVEGTPMAARVAEAAARAGCDPVVLVGGHVSGVAALGYPVMDDDQPGAGPLAAIAVAARTFPGRHLVVLACDLPWLTVDALLAVVDAPPADVVVARTDRPQPLCSRWDPDTVTAITAALAAGERSVMGALDAVRGRGGTVVEVDVPATALRNVNEPADLDG